MKPFLKWAGGKRWLVAEYPHLLELGESRYVEPFLGSGAVYFHIQPSCAVLADSNELLIEAYVGVRDEPEKVLNALKKHQREHGKGYYYRVRSSKPRTLATRAAKFIYLNRTCFNGLYRVNLQGQFNVPKGSKEDVLFSDDDFAAWSRVLKGADLLAQDFEKTLIGVRCGDLVYVDPPYTVRHNTNNFLKYNERIFSWDDQVRLSRCLHVAARKGARVIISNADHPSVQRLYPGDPWRQHQVHRYSRLAACSDHRRPTTEILISNCLHLE